MAKTPKRVLVVDNDEHVLKSVRFNLEINDYDVLTAGSQEEAEALIANEIIHLAIIDVRLQHEKRADDQSGFNLAQKLPDHIPFIIFSAYEDKELAKRALRDFGAQESLDKKDPHDANRLVEVVDDLFANVVKVNFDLTIDSTLDLQEVAGTIEVHGDPSKPSSEDVCQVLQALLNEAESISATSLLEPNRALAPTPSGSVVLKVRPRYPKGWGELLVVKLGEKDIIAQEAANYREIRPFLGGHRLAVLEGIAYSRGIGGIAYRLIGAQGLETIHTFEEIYKDRPAEVLVDLLEKFFERTFGGIFANAHREEVDLVKFYVESLSLSPDKLRRALSRFRPDALHEPHLRFDAPDIVLPNPLMWVGAFGSERVQSMVCLCHGDLHGQNILVDAGGHFWLIDFARTTESHAVRDFVELENNIKFELLPSTELGALFRFEQCLFSPATFGTPVPKTHFDDEELDKACRVVWSLRHTAGRLLSLDAGHLREYYLALLLDTLKVISLQHIDTSKKEYALLSAAWMCQKMETQA